MSIRLPLSIALAACSLAGCASWRGAAPTEPAESLTHLVTELHMHLREDTYRYARPRSQDGRDLLEVALWKLDRLERERARVPASWEPADQVIAFAQARTLERLRRYAAAAAAYERVAALDSILSEPARENAALNRRLAAASSGIDAADVAAVEARIRDWREIVWELRGTSHASLAREELESWQVLRVERLAASGDAAAALDACERLVEAHRESKNVGRHLVRLGDLYAQAARLRAVEHSVAGAPATHAEVLVDRAFTAWELAAETRDAGARRAAEARIQALDADVHGGGHAP